MDKLLARLRSPLAVIGLIAFVDALGFAITLPLFSLYALNQFGASPSEITGVQAGYFAMSFLVGPLLGKLSDKYGRRPVLIVSQLGSVFSYLIVGLAPSLLWLYIGRAVDGITAGNFSTVQAYISDVTEPKDRAKRLGMVALAFSMGLSIGPFIGAQVAAISSVSTVYFIGALISCITILLSWFFLKESLTPQRRAEAAAMRAKATGNMWDLITRPTVATLLIVFFLAQFAFFSFQTTLGLWTQYEIFPTLPQEEVQKYVSYILTLVGLCGVFVQLRMIGPLVMRFGERTMAQVGLLSRTLFFFGLLLLVPVPGLMILCAPLLAFGTGMMMPNITALQTYAAPDRRGQIIGIGQSAGSLGSIFGPLVGGWIFQNLSHSAPMIMSGLLSLLAFVISLNLLRYKLDRPVVPQMQSTRT